MTSEWESESKRAKKKTVSKQKHLLGESENKVSVEKKKYNEKTQVTQAHGVQLLNTHDITQTPLQQRSIAPTDTTSKKTKKKIHSQKSFHLVNSLCCLGFIAHFFRVISVKNIPISNERSIDRLRTTRKTNKLRTKLKPKPVDLGEANEFINQKQKQKLICEWKLRVLWLFYWKYNSKRQEFFNSIESVEKKMKINKLNAITQKAMWYATTAATTTNNKQTPESKNNP